LCADPSAADRWLLEVEADPVAGRLDAWLAVRLPELSRTRAAALIEAGQVRVDGKPARKSHRPEAGQTIEVEIPSVEPTDVRAEALPLVILYEDKDLVVLDKPSGIVVHPSAGHVSGTLVNALLFHIGDLSGIGGVRRPGIVHRLDKDTSGLMLVAKNDASHRRLSAALKAREIRRRYLAVVWGHLREEEVVVEAPIGRASGDRKRMAVVPGGRAARTRLLRLERWNAADLVRAELDTGRTHQIRVHLAWIGHPVVGDAVYGRGREHGMGGSAAAWTRALAQRVPRQFLHAAELELLHPRTGEPLRFESPLPADLAAAASWARADAGG
jgi:23S rRNA pseudouridine1911/1915/1917 synthase